MSSTNLSEFCVQMGLLTVYATNQGIAVQSDQNQIMHIKNGTFKSLDCQGSSIERQLEMCEFCFFSELNLTDLISLQVVVFLYSNVSFKVIEAIYCAAYHGHYLQ